MKKIIALLLTAFLIVTCIGTMSFADQTDSVKVYKISDIKDKIKIYGRSIVTDKGISCDWSASGIEFTANCEGDISIALYSSAVGYYSVYIDGVMLDKRLRVASGENTVVLAEGLSLGTHTVKMLKQTEATGSLSEIESIIINGTIEEKPADSKYLMEFVGDSITCGHSALAFSGSDNVSPYYEDGTRTYALLTAQNFGADHSVVSMSGSTYSGMYEQYNYFYKSRNSSLTFDYAKKPNVVVINLGTNDGTRTVDYYQTQVGNFVSRIRNGYNDQNIPVVLVHSAMQADGVRANLTAAVKALGGKENKLYTVCFSRSGTHPRLTTHKNDSIKLSSLLINEGIMPASALLTDATATVSQDTGSSMIYNGDYSSGSLSSSGVSLTKSYTGNVNLESVNALAENSDNYALKVTTDGNSTDTKLYSIKGTNLTANVSNTKGIRFYINYSGTFDKKIYMQTSDKTGSCSFEATEGQNNCVNILWEDLPTSMNYVYLGIVNSKSIGQIALDFGTGAYSCTIDDIQYIRNDYLLSNNANTSYKLLTEMPEFYGNLSGLETTTTTTSTSSSGTTVPTTVANHDISYVAASCSPAKSDAGVLGEYTQTDMQPNGTLVSFAPNAAGDYVEFTLPNVPAGSYKLSTYSRDYSSRGSFSVTANSDTVGSVNYAASSLEMNTREIGSLNQAASGNITLRFTAQTGGNIYIYKIFLDNVGGGTTVSSSSSTTTTTTSTTTTTTTTTSATTTTTVAPGEAVCVIGTTEYSSLFGTEGAIANAQTGDRIIMVADETYDYSIANSANSVCQINVAELTIDFAGHTLTVTKSNKLCGILTTFSSSAVLNLVSTVEGKGETNTSSYGVYKGAGLLVYSSGTTNIDNMNLTTTVTDDNWSSCFKSNNDTAVLNVKNSYFYSGKNALFAGANIKVNFENSSINGPYYVLRSSGGKAITGLFKNTIFNCTNTYGMDFSSDNQTGLKFEACTVKMGTAYDTYPISISAGTVTLSDNTVVDGNARAKYCLRLNNSAKVILDNSSVKNCKQASGCYGIYFSSTTAVLEAKDCFISGSSSGAASNKNLYSYLATGKALYSSATPSAETLIAIDYEAETVKSAYVRDALKTQYDVTLDGVATKYDEGSTFTFPTLGANGVAYTDGTNYYAEGEAITVNSNLLFSTASVNLSMSYGAAMRFNNPTGMRFYTDIDTDLIDSLRSAGATVTLGTIISPIDIIGNQVFTKEMTGKYVDVEYNSTEWYSENSFKGLVGSIASIQEKNVNRQFVGRGYATITFGSVTKTIYASFASNDIANNSRTICYIAKQITLGNEYASLSENNKKIVDFYVSKYIES